MELLTPVLRAKLIENYKRRDDDHVPVVKWFTPWANATWLLKDMSPEEDILFGLCDLGLGEPELGYVSLHEVQSIRGPAGLRIERDLHFQTDLPLSRWTKTARIAGRIINPE